MSNRSYPPFAEFTIQPKKPPLPPVLLPKVEMQRIETTEWPRVGLETRREFEAFFCEHQEHVLRIALAITGDREAASDAAQEAFVKVLDRWRRVRAMEKPEAFLKRIAVRCAIDVLRDRRGVHEITERAAASFDPDGIAVRQTLARLKPDQQAVLALAVGQGWSYAEVAEALGIPAGTVASRIHAAKEAFRRHWGNEQ